MPPRLLPKDEFGYVDTLHVGKAASIWTTNKVRAYDTQDLISSFRIS